MNYEVTVHYTPALLRKAVGHFWRTYTAWHGFAILVIMPVITVADFLSGDRSWMLGILSALTAIAFLFNSMVYVVHLRLATARLHRMPQPTAKFIFSDDKISIESSATSSAIPWSTIQGVWRFPGVWLLFYSRSLYITLPTEGIPADALDFVESQVKKHGGRVV